MYILEGRPAVRQQGDRMMVGGVGTDAIETTLAALTSSFPYLVFRTQDLNDTAQALKTFTE